MLLFKATGVPPGAAMPLSVTVPVDEFPPFTEVGLRLNDRSAAGEIVSLAVGAALFRVAVIVAVVCALTPVVVTANVAVVCPAGTVTDAGTVAAATLLLVVTTVPVAPAGPLRVTVPVEPLPPNTDDGLKVSEARVAGVTVRFAFKEVPANVAVIVTGVEALTPEVLTVNGGRLPCRNRDRIGNRGCGDAAGKQNGRATGSGRSAQGNRASRVTAALDARWANADRGKRHR